MTAPARPAIRRSVRWSGLAAGFATVASVVQLIALTRLLSAEDFGLSAMAGTATGLALLVADLGIAGAILHRQETSRNILTTLYLLSLTAGVLCWLATTLAAPLAGLWFKNDSVTTLIAIGALGLLTAPLGAIHQSCLERDSRFDLIAVIESAAVLTTTVLTLALAWRGFGAAAFPLGIVAGSLAKALGFMATGALPLGRPAGLKEVSAHLAFGSAQVGQRLCGFIISNADYLLIGRFMGAAALGPYMLAFQLAVLPTGRLNALLGRIALSVLAKRWTAKQGLGPVFFAYHEAASLINLTYLGILGAVAAPLILLNHPGSDWATLPALLAVMSVLAAGRALAGTVGPLLTATGNAKLGFRWSLLILVLQVPTLGIACLSLSTMTVAITFCCVQWLYLALTYILLVRRMIGPCLGEFIRPSMLACACGALAAASAMLCYAIAGPGREAAMVAGLAALAPCSLLVWLLRRTYVHDLRAILLGSSDRAP